MRVLGLDVGKRRIGIAVSDALGLTAQPVTVMTRSTLAEDLDVIRQLCEERDVERIVVGLPVTMAGRLGPAATRMRAFARALQQAVAMPVDLADERLPTVQGERTLLALGKTRKKRKAVIDQVAAQLILQHYLDRVRDATG